MSEYPVPAVRRRHRRSRVEVAQIASSYPQSGLSRSQFCHQHGLSLSTLNKYCQHARSRDAAPSASMSKPLSAVELALARVEFVEKSATHTEQRDPLLVELAGGRRIAVSAGFDAATLTRLIAVLEQA
jgi:transposase-like protein